MILQNTQLLLLTPALRDPILEHRDCAFVFEEAEKWKEKKSPTGFP